MANVDEEDVVYLADEHGTISSGVETENEQFSSDNVAAQADPGHNDKY